MIKENIFLRCGRQVFMMFQGSEDSYAIVNSARKIPLKLVNYPDGTSYGCNNFGFIS